MLEIKKDNLKWVLVIFLNQLITFLLIGIIVCFACPRERTLKSIVREWRQGKVRPGVLDFISI